MKWIKQGSKHTASPYRVMLSMRGFEAYVYSFSKEAWDCLGKRISNLADAKTVCEKHAIEGAHA